MRTRPGMRSYIKHRLLVHCFLWRSPNEIVDASLVPILVNLVELRVASVFLTSGVESAFYITASAFETKIF